jgi:14-3-3 protein epsilon
MFMVRVAEKVERYDDMVSFLIQLLELRGTELGWEERNLMTQAFKGLIAPKRKALQKFTAIELPQIEN